MKIIDGSEGQTLATHVQAGYLSQTSLTWAFTQAGSNSNAANLQVTRADDSYSCPANVRIALTLISAVDSNSAAITAINNSKQGGFVTSGTDFTALSNMPVTVSSDGTSIKF